MPNERYTVILREKYTEKKAAAKLALDHRLFVPGWQLKPILECQYYLNKEKRTPKDFYFSYRISLAYDDHTPVGVAVLYFSSLEQRNMVAVFVKPNHRRQNIGTMLITALQLDLEVGQVYYGNGMKSTHYFWDKFKNISHI